MKRIIPVLLVLFCISCDQNILDITPQDRIAESSVWNDPNLIEAYHTELYNAIPHGFYIHMNSKFTDEAYNSAPCCGADIFALNTYSPDNIAGAGGGDDFWAEGSGYFYYWDRGFEYIRKINVFLQQMEELDVVLENKDRMIAEAKFLRAFINFKLIKRFGGIPIVDQAYGLESIGEVEFQRASFDEVVEFIEQDLSEAIPDLQDRYPSTDANYGRATVDAAQALRSRMYLFAASPLHNPSNDQQRWQQASDAAAALIGDEGGVGFYSLYPDYQQLFLLSSGDAQDEVIFSRGFTSSNGHQAPMHNFNRRYEAYGGWWGSNGPVQNLVDDYDMINGEPPFLADGSVNPNSGYDPQDPFTDRDPRFYATILHDGDTFRGDLYEMWIAEDGSQWGFDSFRNTGDNPRTNYVLKKFMPTDGPFNWDVTFTMQYPHFRLAEIYLNYAEAQFELGNEAKAREYLNKVRSRQSVNLPDIPETITGEDLRNRIYKERRVELAYEGHRWFDVRRWRIAEEVENAPIRTLDIYMDLSTGEKRYEEVILLDRSGTFQEFRSLLPIAEDEIRRTGIEQNPGY